jgi:hypothetical protein
MFGTLALVVYFNFSKKEALKMTGESLFPISLGWQLANNSLYMFQYNEHFGKSASAQNKDIDQLADVFYFSVPPDFYNQLEGYAGDYFILDSKSPLNKFLLTHYNPSTDSLYIVSYARASVIYSQYGWHQISHNPAAYFWQYVIPNTKRYLAPPAADFNPYSENEKQIDSLSKKWFQIETIRNVGKFHSIPNFALSVNSILFLFLNIYFVGVSLWILFGSKLFDPVPKLRKPLMVTSILLIINFIYSIFFSSITLKTQSFILLISIPFSLLLFELKDKKNVQAKQSSNLLVNPNTNPEPKEPSLTV